jgi:hypothetical protein
MQHVVSGEDLARAICLAHDHLERLKPWCAGKLTAWWDGDSGAVVVVYDPKGERAREMEREYANAGA